MRFQRDFPGMISTPRSHADIRNLQRIAPLPALLAALVALVGLGTVTHALISCTRTRRSDLAILKTLGFLRGQVTATIAWQASTFAVIALALGLPLGLTAGRWVGISPPRRSVSAPPQLSRPCPLSPRPPAHWWPPIWSPPPPPGRRAVYSQHWQCAQSSNAAPAIPQA